MDFKMLSASVMAIIGFVMILYNAYSYLTHQETSSVLFVLGIVLFTIGAKQIKEARKRD